MTFPDCAMYGIATIIIICLSLVLTIDGNAAQAGVAKPRNADRLPYCSRAALSWTTSIHSGQPIVIAKFKDIILTSIENLRFGMCRSLGSADRLHLLRISAPPGLT
jgi:hypothetical protein